MTTYTYYPKGTCSKQMEVDLEDGVIKDVRVLGGCNGNLQGISSLVRGMKATFSSCPPQCVDFPDGNFHARQRSFRHRAGLYDPDAFTHFDQPESRSIFWFGFSRGRKRGAKT